MSEILYLDRKQKNPKHLRLPPGGYYKCDVAAFQHIKTQSALREDAEHAAVWFKVFNVDAANFV